MSNALQRVQQLQGQGAGAPAVLSCFSGFPQNLNLLICLPVQVLVETEAEVSMRPDLLPCEVVGRHDSLQPPRSQASCIAGCHADYVPKQVRAIRVSS